VNPRPDGATDAQWVLRQFWTVRFYQVVIKHQKSHRISSMTFNLIRRVSDAIYNCFLSVKLPALLLRSRFRLGLPPPERLRHHLVEVSFFHHHHMLALEVRLERLGLSSIIANGIFSSSNLSIPRKYSSSAATNEMASPLAPARLFFRYGVRNLQNVGQFVIYHVET
jgi:hypothetical protein